MYHLNSTLHMWNFTPKSDTILVIMATYKTHNRMSIH